MNATKKFLSIGTLLLILAAGAEVFAQESDKFELTVAPYAWFPNVKGDVTIGQQTTNLDLGANADIDKTEFAGVLQLEARFGRFGLFLQPNYFKVDDSQEILRTHVDLTMKFWMLEFGGFFRLIELGKTGAHPSAGLDLLVGGRYWGISTETHVSSPVNVTERGESAHITEPFVGLRLSTFLTNHLFFKARGDFGGFGVSTNDVKSRYTWQALASLGYQFNPLFGIEAGYRWMSVDMKNESLPFNNEINLDFKGPFAGALFRF